MKGLKPHKFADRMPAMTDAEYEALRLSIASSGQIDPIVLLDGQILDGRHRYRVCQELGLQPKVLNFQKSWGNPVEFVIGKNAHRNASDGQKAWAAAQFADDLAPLNKPGPRDERKSALINGKSCSAAALLFGVSARNVEFARSLMRQSPKLFARLGSDRSFNVNRAMQEFRKAGREKTTQRLRSKPVALTDADLIQGDVIDRLESIESETATVIFTDPPYNIGKSYHGDPHADSMHDTQFIEWCARWISECARILTMDGSIFVMMNGLYAARLEIVMRTAGLRRRNTIYWWENNPENQKGNFSDAVRQILYFTRSDDFIFNDDVRVPSRRNEIGDKRGIDAGKLPDNVWIDNRIPGNSLGRVPFADAPPQLPVAIPETCIRVASNPGDTVLDPFNGNGTTGIAALTHGRKYIGIERSKKYLDQSRKWIAAQLAQRET